MGRNGLVIGGWYMAEMIAAPRALGASCIRPWAASLHGVIERGGWCLGTGRESCSLGVSLRSTDLRRGQEEVGGRKANKPGGEVVSGAEPVLPEQSQPVHLAGRR